MYINFTNCKNLVICKDQGRERERERGREKGGVNEKKEKREGGEGGGKARREEKRPFLSKIRARF